MRFAISLPFRLNECRQAFFAGATCLHELLMTGFDAGDDATDGDIATMQDIDADLREFRERFVAGRLPPEGSA